MRSCSLSVVPPGLFRLRQLLHHITFMNMCQIIFLYSKRGSLPLFRVSLDSSEKLCKYFVILQPLSIRLVLSSVSCVAYLLWLLYCKDACFIHIVNHVWNHVWRECLPVKDGTQGKNLIYGGKTSINICN